MQFINEAPLFKVVKITGPTHNLLGLELSLVPSATPPTIEVLDRDKVVKDPLIQAEVLKEILEGMEIAGKEFGRKFYLKRVQYLASDTRPVSTYAELTVEIIRRSVASL